MKKRYEDSAADLAEDRKGAKKLGVSMKAYEATARDKAEDRKGQARLDAQEFCEGGFVLPHLKAKREGR